MNKLITTMVAASAMLLTSTVPALAACTIRDLAGSWRAMALGTESDGSLLRVDCAVVFNRLGRMTSVRCLPGRTTRLPSASLIEMTRARVGRNCWVQIRFEDHIGGLLFDGHMTPNKQHIAGVAKDLLWPAYATVNMVRHSR